MAEDEDRQQQIRPGLTIAPEVVLSTKIPVLKHVPKAFRIQWCSALSQVISRFCEAPGDTSRQVDLFGIAKALLHPLKRGGSSRPRRALHELQTRLDLWNGGQADLLWGSAESQLHGKGRSKQQKDCEPPNAVEFDEQWRSRVIHAAQESNIHTAGSLLLAESTLVEPTPEVTAALQELHPPLQYPLPMEPPPEHEDVEVEQEVVLESLRSFPRDSASGPSGLRPNHIKEAFRCNASGPSSELLESLTLLTSMAANGQLPACLSALFAAARLLPFRKKSGGIRPIAVGDVFRRLIGKSLLKLHQAEVVDQSLYPVQLGVGVQGATELIARGVNYFLNESTDRTLVLLQLDFKNAFNSCSRSRLITQTRLLEPALAPWVEFLYTTEAPLLMSEALELRSREGVQQGDPLAPLLFSLVAQPLAENIGMLPGVTWNAWYIDDGNIITTAAGARLVLDLVLSEGHQHGLFLNLNKTTISGHGLTPEYLQSLGLPGQLLQLCPCAGKAPAATVLGTPVGPQPFLKLQMAPILEKVRRLCRAVRHLRHSQVSLMLLRQSLGICRVTHILRTVDPTAISAELEALDSIYLDTFRFLAFSDLTPDAWVQGGLPIKLGGVGLAHCTDVAPLAYGFSGKCSDLKLPTSASLPPKAFVSACSLISPALCPAVAELKHAAETSSEPLKHSDPQAQSQHWWTTSLHAKSLRDLISRASARDRVRLQSLQLPLSGSWLTALPSSKLGLSFSSSEFEVLLRTRLGLPVYHSRPGPCPLCGDALDSFGDHATCCAKSNLTARHNGVTSAIGRVLASAGLTVTYEVAVAGKLRPADVHVRGLSFPEPDVLDATVVNPMAGFDDPAAADRVARAERHKHEKYDELCQRAKVKLTAFGVSTLGGVGPEAYMFLGRIREKFIQEHGKTEGSVLAQEAMERISVACQRGVAAQLLKSIGGLAPTALPAPGAQARAPSECGDDAAMEAQAAMEP